MKSPLIFLLLQTRTRRKEDGFSPWIRRLRTEIPAGTDGDIAAAARQRDRITNRHTDS